jgi:hypothetical protein
LLGERLRALQPNAFRPFCATDTQERLRYTPVWMPINYLLIESLQKFHHYYGDDFQVECPTGSGQFTTLNGVANELSNRLIRI